jgi:hypothetical protein
MHEEGAPHRTNGAIGQRRRTKILIRLRSIGGCIWYAMVPLPHVHASSCEWSCYLFTPFSSSSLVHSRPPPLDRRPSHPIRRVAAWSCHARACDRPVEHASASALAGVPVVRRVPVSCDESVAMSYSSSTSYPPTRRVADCRPCAAYSHCSKSTAGCAGECDSTTRTTPQWSQRRAARQRRMHYEPVEFS